MDSYHSVGPGIGPTRYIIRYLDRINSTEEFHQLLLNIVHSDRYLLTFTLSHISGTKTVPQPNIFEPLTKAPLTFDAGSQSSLLNIPQGEHPPGLLTVLHLAWTLTVPFTHIGTQRFLLAFKSTRIKTVTDLDSALS